MPYHAGSPDLGTAGTGTPPWPFGTLPHPADAMARSETWGNRGHHRGSGVRRHPRDCADDMTAWEIEVLVAVAQGLTSGPGI